MTINNDINPGSVTYWFFGHLELQFRNVGF